MRWRGVGIVVSVLGVGASPGLAGTPTPSASAARQSSYGVQAANWWKQISQAGVSTGAFRRYVYPVVPPDSDGPLDSCRPVPPDQAEALAARCPALSLVTAKHS